MAAYLRLVGYFVCVWIFWGVCEGKDQRNLQTNKGWHQFGGSEYLFLLDSAYSLDRTRSKAKQNCRNKTADLVSLDTEQELDFIKSEIRRQLRSQGQELRDELEETWWTNGISYKQFKWIWDTPERPEVTSSALKRSSVPRNGPHYLALTHSGSWRLKVVPGNFKHRYVCERAASPNQSSQLPVPPVSAGSLLSLRQELFSRYDKTSEPFSSHTEDVITIDVRLQQIHDNVTENTINVQQDVVTAWLDRRLAWNTGEVREFEEVAASVWYPDVTYRQMSSSRRTPCQLAQGHRVHIHRSGDLNLTRICRVTYNCTLEKPATFPFDYQHCRLNMYVQNAGAKVHVTGTNSDVIQTGFRSAWTLSSLSAETVGQTQGKSVSDHTEHLVTVYLHRNIIYHVLTLLVPCLFLALVLLVLLWLPHGSGPKCLATLLVTSTFLLYLGLGGRHRFGHGVTYSDLYMLVMAVISLVSLVSQFCVWRLLRRQKQQIPPPPWMEKVIKDHNTHRITTGKLGRQKHAPSKHEINKNKELEHAKWLEEKELMLGEQTLGMTSLGKDARITVPPEHFTTSVGAVKCDGYTLTSLSSDSDRLPSARSHPNGSTKQRSTPDCVYHGSASYRDVIKTSALSTADKKQRNSRQKAGADMAEGSVAESFDSGCHSATKTSPDITMETSRRTIKSSQWKRCFVWFDRAVSLIISAAVIFTIMIFTILFLAT